MEAIMNIKQWFVKAACSSFCILFLCSGHAFAKSSTTGQDWYCSDPAAHKHYAKHLKEHLHHSSDTIAAQLDAIYTDEALNSDERKKKVLLVLDRYLLKLKAGTGD